MLPGLAPSVGRQFDPYWSSVYALMSFDGPSVVTNSGPVANAFTARGNVSLSSTQKRFGPTAAYFDGSGDAVYSSNSFALPGEYTFEMSFFPTVAQNGTLIDLRSSDSENTEAPALTFLSNRTVSVWMTGASRITSAGTFALNTWHHLILRRKAGVVAAFVNGDLLGTVASTANLTARYLTCGTTVSGTANSFAGYGDELRATIGVGRDAVVPTAPYPRG